MKHFWSMSQETLDFMVISFPFVISVIGILFGSPHKHRLWWGVGLISVGAIMSFLTYWQRDRQRTREAEAASEFEKRVTQAASERADGVQKLMDKVDGLSAQPTAFADWTQQQVPVPVMLSPEEIASAVSQQMRNMQAVPDAPPAKAPPVDVPPAVSAPTPLPEVIEPEVQQAAIKEPCRAERLNDCTTDELIDWGRPIILSLESIENSYAVRIRSLDDIPTLDWVTELFNSRESRRHKLNARIQDDTTEEFRQCCLMQTTKYYQELARRVGVQGLQTPLGFSIAGVEPYTLAFAWMQHIATSTDSSFAWDPSSEGKNILIVLGDLYSMQIKLATGVGDAHPSTADSPQTSKPAPSEPKASKKKLPPDNEPINAPWQYVHAVVAAA